jgi:endonuclease/exonuclease/phosphatase family metal-dependent hydrolase
MRDVLRVMTWNTGEAPDSQLPLMARWIQHPDETRPGDPAPDFVLLNELMIRRWWTPIVHGHLVHQPRELQRLTSLPHIHWANSANLGVQGFKAVCVLSQWPLGAASKHSVGGFAGFFGYAILQTSANLDGVPLHIFSLRLDAHDLAAQVKGLALLRSLLTPLPAGDAVVAAGDFNCGVADPHFVAFARDSGLRDAFTERPDDDPTLRCDLDEPGADFDRNKQHVIDHIFFRGPFRLVRTIRRCGSQASPPNPSDHAWTVAYLQIIHAAGAMLAPAIELMLSRKGVDPSPWNELLLRKDTVDPSPWNAALLA